MKEVIRRFDLKNRLNPFTRCLECNGMIESVELEYVKDHVKSNTLKNIREFYRCQSCGKIYWKGSHFKRMAQLIDHLII